MILPDSWLVLSVAVIVGILCELGALFIPQKRWLPVIAGFSIVFSMFAGGILLALLPTVGSALLVILAVHRAVSLLRLLELRLPKPDLYRHARRSFWRLLFLQLVSGSVYWWWYQHEWQRFSDEVFLILAGGMLLAATILFAHTLRVMWRARLTGASQELPLSKKPTVSVLIPARNESEELSLCLQSLLASTYPKLEILVLDDCSQDQTPDVIKQFAQDGVRFIGGKKTPASWLAKNYAYEQLTLEASGDVLVFAGVDVHLAPDSIDRLIGELEVGDYNMLSVMPRRQGQDLIGIFAQPMRYFWELAIPAFLHRHPPVLSTCWVIRQTAYRKSGGMKAFSRAIIPEVHLARQQQAIGRYHFLIAGSQLGVVAIKNIREQIATAVRTRYPQLRRRPEKVALVSLAHLTFNIGPFLLLFLGLAGWLSDGATLLAGLACVLLVATNALIAARSAPGTTFMSLVSFPITVAAELVWIYLSMYKYEFGVVEWKGRNICLPILQTFRSLPAVK